MHCCGPVSVQVVVAGQAINESLRDEIADIEAQWWVALFDCHGLVILCVLYALSM